MTAKTVFSAALALSAIGFCAARGQTPMSTVGMPSMPVPAIASDNQTIQASGTALPPLPMTVMPRENQVGAGSTSILPPVPASAIPTDDKAASEGSSPPGLSPYITYQRPECCGPFGGDGPIQIDLYAGSGFSLPFGNNDFGKILDLGWEVEGGARSLFFNPARSAAWVVDLGIINIWNHANRPDVQIPLILAGGVNQTVTVSGLNRTFVSLGLGRDWILGDSSHGGGHFWRLGVEGGFRYGSSSLDLNEIQHRTDTIAGAFVGVHANVEIPYGACVLVAGLKAEWAYTWSDILQFQNDSDISEFNIVIQAGVRF